MKQQAGDRVRAQSLPRRGITARGLALLLAAVSVAWAGEARAHGGETHGAAAQAAVVKEQKPWGIAGDADKVTRTIRIGMHDTMRFDPARVEVAEGETVRFEIVNAGAVLHEMVIGTADELDAHAAMMARFPKMEHDEPYMSHVDAGQTGAIVWHFNRPGQFDFACLIPGHYQAGMVGRIIVEPKR